MKKLLMMLVTLTITIGVFPIVANAQNEPDCEEIESEAYPIYLSDVNEDCAITYIDVLNYVALVTTLKYPEDSQQSKDLWLIHEVCKKLTEEQAMQITNDIILNF